MSVLSELQGLIQAGERTSSPHVIGANNRFFTLIPHDFGVHTPPILNELPLVKVRFVPAKNSPVKLLVCSIDWLIDFLIGRYFVRLIDWLIGWLTDDWSIGWLIDWLFGWLVDWLIIQVLIDFPFSLLQEKLEMLENLLDIEVAFSILRSENHNSNEDPLDQVRRHLLSMLITCWSWGLEVHNGTLVRRE